MKKVKRVCPNCTNVDLEGPFCSDEYGTMEISETYCCDRFKKQSLFEKIKRKYYLWRMNRENKN
jgi:hypothetical protein